MSDAFDTTQFIAGFLAETEEHLRAATANLLSIEKAAETAGRREPTPRQVRELFRSLHTIKGLAAMVGVEAVVDMAHAMETVLREANRSAGLLPEGAVELLLQGVQAIEQRVRALEKGGPIAAAPAHLIDRLSALRQSGGEGAADTAGTTLAPEIWGKLNATERTQLVQGIGSGRRGWLAHFVPAPALADAGINITTIRERVAAVAEIVKIVPRSVPATDDRPGGLAFALVLLGDGDAGPLAEAAATTEAELVPIALERLDEGSPDETEPADELGDGLRRRDIIRVEVARLDDALEKLAALVVTQFRLNRALAALRASGADLRALSQVLAENGRQLRDLRASIMRARMVPVGELLERVPLIVRGLSRTTGKEARLELAAGHAELDKAVAERVFPVIVHLVRNAVDHALESPEVRRAAGKPEVGVIRVTCFERADNQLELSVADDGRGIDAVAVARRAGVPVPATNDALLELLARPGLSTKTEVTTTSGRGMGMDVVRRVAVEELRGELALETEAGRGTTFVLRIPLSITIVDAFSFACGGETFVVPVSTVEEIQEVDLARTVRGPDRRKQPRGGQDRRRSSRPAGMIERRGEAVPVLRLDEIFGLPPPETDRRKAIIVRRNGEPFAFAVDRMLGQQEVVVRPLEDRLVRVDGISGTTDLGDGRPTLVLDLAALGGKLMSESAGAGR